MMYIHILHEELAGLEFDLLQETTRARHEGELHKGTGSVIQMLARKA